MPARLLVTAGATALALGALAPAAAWADSPQDPRGNNGTIKIDPYGSTSGNANSPHPGCDFRLQLFGFDDGQTGTITFSGQAPTAGAVTRQPLSGTQQLSDDRAGGGQDVDAHFDIRGAELGLTGTPAKQGFHIRVEVNADGAPGGAKTKVFWLSCPGSSSTTTSPAGSESGSETSSETGSAAAPATSSTTTTQRTTTTQSTATQGTTRQGTTNVQGTTSGAATAVTTSTTSTTATLAEEAERLATARSGARRTTTLGAAVESAETGATLGGATAASTGRTGAPGGLPFTGIPAAALAGLGLAVTAAGVLAVAAGRRRRTTA